MSVRERKPFVGGNWKMNGSYESIDGIIKFLMEGNLSSNIGESIFEDVIFIASTLQRS